jgi:hypothetical protein
MADNIKRLFKYFTDQSGIQIPKNVLQIYLSGKNNNSEFFRLFKSHIDSLKRGSVPDLSVLISEKFVNEILTLIHKYPYENRTTILFQEVYDYQYKGREIEIGKDVEDFVIEEILYSVNDYNYKENRFDFPLVQEAYQNLGSDTEQMKVVLLLWGHCGGEGGLIVRGKNVGYDTGYTHDESSQIEFNRKIYEYKGFLFEKHEELHKPIPENSES